jgi:hypothetical protein
VKDSLLFLRFRIRILGSSLKGTELTNIRKAVSKKTEKDPKKNIENNKFKLLTLLRIRDVYPGSRILIFIHPGSRIPDPKTATKEKGEKEFVVLPFFVATNITKLRIN